MSTDAGAAPPPAAKTAFRVGIISGSARVVRVGPQIAAFVRAIIEADLAKSPPLDGVTLAFEDIDIGAVGLPLFDEPGIPSKITPPEGYAHEHTRAWSRRIAALDAFVFVTSQHNWGVPAGLKNAIDYLFHEWRGKPFMVVSYGGHGGGHAAAALRLILDGGIKMRAVATDPVSLSFPDRGVLQKASRGADLGLAPAGPEATWQDRQEDILQAWHELVELLMTIPVVTQ